MHTFFTCFCPSATTLAHKLAAHVIRETGCVNVWSASDVQWRFSWIQPFYLSMPCPIVPGIGHARGTRVSRIGPRTHGPWADVGVHNEQAQVEGRGSGAAEERALPAQSPHLSGLIPLEGCTGIWQNQFFVVSWVRVICLCFRNSGWVWLGIEFKRATNPRADSYPSDGISAIGCRISSDVPGRVAPLV